MLFQHGKCLIDVLGYKWRQSKRRFINHQHLRLAHQTAAKGQHPSFTTTKRTSYLVNSILEAGEYPKDLLKLAVFASIRIGQVGAQKKVFPNRHARKDQVTLRYMDQSCTDDLIWSPAINARSVERDHPSRSRDQS